MKETEDNACLWIGKLILFKYPHYPKHLQIQCNLYQNNYNIFHRTRNNLKMCMEPKKTLKSHSNPYKRELSWSHIT